MKRSITALAATAALAVGAIGFVLPAQAETAVPDCPNAGDCILTDEERAAQQEANRADRDERRAANQADREARQAENRADCPLTDVERAAKQAENQANRETRQAENQANREARQAENRAENGAADQGQQVQTRQGGQGQQRGAR